MYHDKSTSKNEVSKEKKAKRHLDWFRKNFGELQVDGIVFQTDTEI